MRCVRSRTSGGGRGTVNVTRMVECEFDGEWRGDGWNES